MLSEPEGWTPGPHWLVGRRWTQGALVFQELAESDIETLRGWRNAQTAVLRQNDQISADQQRRWFYDVVRPTHASPAPDFVLVAVRSARNNNLMAYGGLTN